jgi:AcrR family transcriptional regulator
VSDAPVAPRRSDAIRNRGRVITAARAVFAEQGFDACVTDVAERAGVGKATVYRSFPTREHLVAAVVIDRLEWFAERADAALGGPDPAGALGEVMLGSVHRAAADRSLPEAIARVSDMPGVLEAQEGVRAALGALLVAAQDAGGVRRDVAVADVKVLYSGVFAALGPEPDEGALRRGMTLAIDALRPGGRTLPPAGA